MKQRGIDWRDIRDAVEHGERQMSYRQRTLCVGTTAVVVLETDGNLLTAWKVDELETFPPQE